MTDLVDIKGLDKAAVMAALFNASAPQGYGFLQADLGPQVLSAQDAQNMVDAAPAPKIIGRDDMRTFELDYVLGRPLKVRLAGDEFDPSRFDEVNGGPGSAQKVIDRLRATGQVDTAESTEVHKTLTRAKAFEAMKMYNTVTTIDGITVTLGADDADAILQQAVEAEMDRLED